MNKQEEKIILNSQEFSIMSKNKIKHNTKRQKYIFVIRSTAGKKSKLSTPSAVILVN